MVPGEPHLSGLRLAARRDILQHVVYGVDLDPLACELAKVGLWLTCLPDAVCTESVPGRGSVILPGSTEQEKYIGGKSQ